MTHLSPFRAVVLIDAFVTSAWQAEVSDWLVQSGCRYMLAWGRDCSSWDDTVDIANLEKFDYKDIPDDQTITTTWHDDEPLVETFAFCKQHASHPTVAIKKTLVVHITEHSAESQVLAAYAEA